MANQENLPASTAAQYVALSSEQNSSLVTRGLEAIKNNGQQSIASAIEADQKKSSWDLFWNAYEDGDYATAIKFIRPLAKQGDSWAQFQLGFIYYCGKGVKYDDTEAAKWYRKAAEQGYAVAQYNLADMYYSGKGVYEHQSGGLTLNYVQAYKWYYLATMCATPSDNEFREAAVKKCKQLAATMTPAQITEAQKFINEWKPVLEWQTYTVNEVSYYRHKKEGKPDSLRVDYSCGIDTYREWVLIELIGLEPARFPPERANDWLRLREQARSWWMRRSEKQAPNTVTEALDRTDELKVPKAIKVRRIGKYHEIVGYEF